MRKYKLMILIFLLASLVGSSALLAEKAGGLFAGIGGFLMQAIHVPGGGLLVSQAQLNVLNESESYDVSSSIDGATLSGALTAAAPKLVLGKATDAGGKMTARLSKKGIKVRVVKSGANMSLPHAGEISIGAGGSDLLKGKAAAVDLFIEPELCKRACDQRAERIVKACEKRFNPDRCDGDPDCINKMEEKRAACLEKAGERQNLCLENCGIAPPEE